MTLYYSHPVTSADSVSLYEHGHPNPEIPQSTTEAQTPDAKAPLHTHVRFAVKQYLSELDEQIPTNLYKTILQEVEKPLLEVVLEQTCGNQSKTAKILGLNRGTLRKKMQQYGLK